MTNRGREFYMKKLTRVFVILLILTLTLSSFAACGQAKTDENGIILPPKFGDKITATDYSNPNNWIETQTDGDFDVDVFYLYPTAWSRGEGEPYLADIENTSMRATAPRVEGQNTAVFRDSANIYAPFYRQNDAVWGLGLTTEELQDYFRGAPYVDAAAAFEYYIDNYNKVKPFILASHSQGSSVMKAILQLYMAEHPDVYERMIAAYVIGYSVTEDDLKNYPHLKFAEGATDTGVIVSWNTEMPGVIEHNPVVLEGSIAINPISWTRDETPATAEQNLPSRVYESGAAADDYVEYEHYADAAVNLERGVVTCSTINPDEWSLPGAIGWPRGVYHGGDYELYFHSFKQNVADRIAAYMS
jgi:hypothetical protein